MTHTWAAPGRVNLIGEHVDYCGGLVLPFALPLVTTATARQADASTSRRGGHTVTARSERERTPVTFAVDTAPGQVTGWAAYVAGAIWALRGRGKPETLADWPDLDIAIGGTLPAGAGLSSSAAVLCSVLCAVAAEVGVPLSRTEVAALAQHGENGYVGVPSGVMDQSAAMLCTAGNALLLDCRSGATEQVPFDPTAYGLTLLVVDTAVRHANASGEYAARRHSCERAAAELGQKSLRDATPADVARLTDPVTARRAHHVRTEITRVRDVVGLLRAGRLPEIGAALTASHESLRDDFEVSCAELDAVVDAALAAGALGARMTGGGFGGCVIVLARGRDAGQITDAICSSYAEHGWAAPRSWAAAPARGAYAVT